MEVKKCKICSSNVSTAFTVKILNKYDAEYLECSNCGFLFADNPFWLPEAYSNAINDSDTGLVSRNIYFSKVTSVILYFFYGKEKVYLDYAGGYGLFTRLMRDVGFNFYWQDPYCQNLFAKGFEYNKDTNEKPLLSTAFEVFEHLPEPLNLDKLNSITENLLFSTEPLPEKLPDVNNWWYYGFEHGQHISFYRLKTLEYMAKQMNLHFYTFGGLHLFSAKKISALKLKLAVKLAKYGLFWYVTKNMRSKIFDDHTMLKLIE